MPKTVCPACATRSKVRARNYGRLVICPQCRYRYTPLRWAWFWRWRPKPVHVAIVLLLLVAVGIVVRYKTTRQKLVSRPAPVAFA